MHFTRMLVTASVALLTACSSIGQKPSFEAKEQAAKARHEAILDKAPHPNLVGTDEWYEWVDAAAGITDPEGHGPDYGSAEWNRAVQHKVMGFEADESIVFDKNWQRRVDRAIREDRSIFKVF